MPRTLTPIDVHAIMNELVHQATGQQSLRVVDTSSFISAGTTVLATGVENTINSLSIVLSRTMIETDPYQAKLSLIRVMDKSEYSTRLRRISFYSKDAKPAGDWNTDLYENLHMGYDNMENGAKSVGDGNNSTKSMWEQNPPVALEMQFGGVSVWQDCLTVYKYQLKQAFENESAFGAFVAGVMTEKANDIEQQKESWTRSVLLNAIGATYNMNNTGSVINLTAGFNQKFGTSYTSAQLRTTYLDEFTKYFVSQFKLVSDLMTHRTKNYHWSPAKTVDGVNYTLLRHTPKAKQKVLMYNPLFLDVRASVFPEIFNPQYLDQATQFEGVDYWQAFGLNGGAGINVTPAQTNANTGAVEKGNAVALDYVVGMIFHEDAIFTNFTLDDAETSPMEARKKYYNTWYSMARNSCYDPTMPIIIFTMED